MKGLSVEDLCHKSLGIYVTSALSPPPGLEQLWGEFSDLRKHSQVPLDRAHAKAVMDKQAIVIICNPCVSAEVDLLSRFMSGVNELGDEAPILVWMPHTIAPEIRPKSTALAICTHQKVKLILEAGIGGIVNGEPRGVHLALDIRARISHFDALGQKMQQLIRHQMDKRAYADYLKDCIEKMLWDYARKRVFSSIPCLDPKLPSGVPSEVHGYRVGKELGRGMFGRVHKLHPKGQQQENGNGYVIKLMPKEDSKDFSDLKSLKRSIDLMNFMSSPGKRHFNIVKLHEVLHSKTHIILVMEDGGDQNLHQRLHYRDHKSPEKQRPLPVGKVTAVVVQAMAGVQHLHMTVGVAHRDVKPENMLIRESSDNVMLKLTDFDTACSCKTKSICKTVCGTMPFMAPDLLLQKEYDGRKADMWSLGIVMLELLCGIGIIERVLMLDHKHNHGAGEKLAIAPNKSIMKKVYAEFAYPDAAGRMLANFCRQELREIIDSMSSALKGILNVKPTERWDSEQLVEHIDVSWRSQR